MWPIKNFEEYFIAHQYMPKISHDPHKNPLPLNTPSPTLLPPTYLKYTPLTNETNFNAVIYYFQGNTTRKKIYNFADEIILFEKAKSGDMKLEETKKLLNVIKSNLNKIFRGKHKPKE